MQGSISTKCTLHLLLLSLAFAGCADRESRGTTPSGPIAATVGSAQITQDFFDYYATSRSGVPADKLDSKLRGSLLEQLKRLEAAALVAAARPDPATLQELELRRIETLAHAAALAAGVYVPPTEVELQKAYESYVQSLPASEYHVAHILVATQSAADVVLTKLRAHGDFDKLAHAESADDSRVRGGDLGWLSPGKLPAAFSAAVAALKPGQVTLQAVHTPYGWHLIKLIETRPISAPPFDHVRAQLAVNITQDRYQKFLASSLTTVSAH
jgi:peptidyl-prolyl cis-trans isomerase C